MKPLRLLLLPGLAVLLGFFWQLLYPHGLAGKKNPADDGFPRVSWEQSAPQVSAGQWLLLDARPEEQFEALHIPGAISLPSHSYPEALMFFLEEHGKTKTTVIYCSSTDCDTSVELATRLKELGCSDLRILEGGFLSWRRTQP